MIRHTPRASYWIHARVPARYLTFALSMTAMVSHVVGDAAYVGERLRDVDAARTRRRKAGDLIPAIRRLQRLALLQLVAEEILRGEDAAVRLGGLLDGGGHRAGRRGAEEECRQGGRGKEPPDAKALAAKLKERDIPVLLAGMLAPPNFGAAYGREFVAVLRPPIAHIIASAARACATSSGRAPLRSFFSTSRCAEARASACATSCSATCSWSWAWPGRAAPTGCSTWFFPHAGSRAMRRSTICGGRASMN